MKGNHQGTFETADRDGAVKDFQKSGLGFFGQLAVGGAAASVHVPDLFFNKTAEGLNEVIGQGKGVVPIAVMNAEGRQQPRTAQGPGNGGTQDDIAVIEQVIGRRTFSVPAKGGVLQKGGPEPGRGLGLHIFGVAGADASAEGHQDPICLLVRADQMGLMGDFGLDNLLPEAFFEGFAGGNLVPKAFGLNGVGLEGQQESGGQVSAVADDHGGPLL